MPRLRGLRDPRRSAVVPPRARDPAREPRLRLRHRLRGPIPVLPGDVRHAFDPRARARDRDGARDLPPGSLRLGRDRRRRRALDRRQPPDPRAAPERQRDDPALQQPHLRPHEGPVLADVRAGQGDEVDAARLGRPPLQSAVDRDRRRGDLRRPRDRHRQAGLPRGAPRSGRAPRRGLRRDPPELQHLQRRRLRRRPEREGEPSLPPRRRGGSVGRPRRAHAARRHARDRRRLGRRAPPPRSRARRPGARVRACTPHLGDRRRGAARRLPRRWRDPSTRISCTSRSAPPSNARAKATSRRSCTAPIPGQI